MHSNAQHRARRPDAPRQLLLTLTATLVALFLIRPAAAQSPSQIKLSMGADAVAKALAEKSGDGPRVLLFDAATVTPEATDTLLSAIDDLRRGGGTLFALCPLSAAGIKDGAAIAAMACDGVVFVKGAELAGAESDWCTSASRRDRIAADLSRLGRVDEQLARRFLDTTKDLSWSPKSGYTADATGSTNVATAGKRLSLGSPQLKKLGIGSTECESVQAAIAEIAAGKVKPREKTIATTAASTGGTGGKTAPGGKAGSPGAGSPANPPTPKPSTPSAPSAPATPKPPTPSAPAAPAAPVVGQEKLAEKLTEYSKTLADLKGVLKEFNDYYIGVRGVWTSEHRGLKWVWEEGADHTRHPDTKVTCQRLQRDIKTKMGILESCAKTVERIVKDKEHPEVVRMKAHKVALDGLKAGIERNKVSSYETYYKQVMGLN